MFINYLSNFKNTKSIICLQGLEDNQSKKYILDNVKPYFEMNL